MQRCVLNTLKSMLLALRCYRPGREARGLLDPARPSSRGARPLAAALSAAMPCSVAWSYGLLSRFTLLDADSLDDDAWRAGDAMTWQ